MIIARYAYESCLQNTRECSMTMIQERVNLPIAKLSILSRKINISLKTYCKTIHIIELISQLQNYTGKKK